MKSLLIVDDEPQIRRSLSHVFTQTGYKVRVASDGFTALEQMRESVPDVLLSDLNMPGMSGFELLSVVRRKLPGVYVIATSGAYQGDSIPEGIAADAFYEKASQFGMLMQMMRAALNNQESQGARGEPAAPLWITRVGDEGNVSESFGMIGCPECMRAHAYPLRGAELLVNETNCRDCGNVIRYAVVKHLDPSTSQPYRVLLGDTDSRVTGSEPA